MAVWVPSLQKGPKTSAFRIRRPLPRGFLEQCRNVALPAALQTSYLPSGNLSFLFITVGAVIPSQRAVVRFKGEDCLGAPRTAPPAGSAWCGVDSSSSLWTWGAQVLITS